MAIAAPPKRRSAWQSVRRELGRAVTRAPYKVFSKLTGQPWPPVRWHWNLQNVAYDVPLYHHPLSAAEIQTVVGKDDPVMLEIGANNGDDSLRFLNQFGRMKLFCFEPDARAIAKFKGHVADDRCTLIEKAVAAHTGSTSFWPSEGPFENAGWEGSSSIHAPTGHLEVYRQIRFRDVVEVPTISLDDWAADHPELDMIDFIWMDVQGAEHDVLAGAVNTLPKVRFVYSEFYNKPMYEGQRNLTDLLAMLPGFKLLSLHEGINFLAENQRYKKQ